MTNAWTLQHVLTCDLSKGMLPPAFYKSNPSTGHILHRTSGKVPEIWIDLSVSVSYPPDPWVSARFDSSSSSFLEPGQSSLTTRLFVPHPEDLNLSSDGQMMRDVVLRGPSRFTDNWNLGFRSWLQTGNCRLNTVHILTHVVATLLPFSL